MHGEEDEEWQVWFVKPRASEEIEFRDGCFKAFGRIFIRRTERSTPAIDHANAYDFCGRNKKEIDE